MTSRWRMDFAEGAKRDLPNPLGFNTASAELVRPVTLPYAARHPRAADCPFYVQEDAGPRKKGQVDLSLKQKKVWEIAQSSMKSVGMMAFMMWMSGNSVQIFSIGITFTGLWQPLKAIMSSGEMFKRFADGTTDVFLPRLLFCAIQLAGFGIALYKLASMGLLPTNTSDWETIDIPKVLETSLHSMGLPTK